MKYSRQELFRFRIRPLCIDSVLHQKLKNLRLCRRPRGVKAGCRHSHHTAHSTAYKRIQHQPSVQQFDQQFASSSDCLPGSCQRRSSSLAFGCLNIRSLNNKLDDLLEVRRDQAIDVLCLVETWHDADRMYSPFANEWRSSYRQAEATKRR